MEINEKIPGWKDITTLIEVAKIVEQLLPNSRIVEIGSGLGRLTWTLSKNAPNGSIIYAIDCWNNNKLDVTNSRHCINCNENTLITEEEFLRQTRDCDNIIPIHKKFPFNWEYDKVDMIFIDADEDYEAQMSYLKQAFEMIKPNGVICGEDYSDKEWIKYHNNIPKFPGLVQAIHEMAKIHNKQVQFPHINTWLWRYV